MGMQLAERTRLSVDGLPTRITADVTRRRADRLVVTQALPFLRLDTSVTDDDGRRARISRVAIAMDGDVPRLLLELVDEAPMTPVPAPEAEAEVAEEADATTALETSPAAEDEPPSAEPSEPAEPEADVGEHDDTLESWTPGVSTRPARTDSTVPYELSGRDSRQEVVLVDQIELAPETLAALAPPRPGLFVRVARWIAALFRRPFALARG